MRENSREKLQETVRNCKALSATSGNCCEYWQSCWEVFYRENRRSPDDRLSIEGTGYFREN